MRPDYDGQMLHKILFRLRDVAGLEQDPVNGAATLRMQQYALFEFAIPMDW